MVLSSPQRSISQNVEFVGLEISLNQLFLAIIIDERDSQNLKRDSQVCQPHGETKHLSTVLDLIELVKIQCSPESMF